jgi:hypothetical protein
MTDKPDAAVALAACVSRGRTRLAALSQEIRGD